MRQQFFDRVVFATERLFFWYKAVYRVVAISTDADRFLHLLATKLSLEPFVGMAGARN